MAHTSNLSTLEVEQEDLEFQVILGSTENLRPARTREPVSRRVKPNSITNKSKHNKYSIFFATFHKLPYLYWFTLSWAWDAAQHRQSPEFRSHHCINKDWYRASESLVLRRWR